VQELQMPGSRIRPLGEWLLLSREGALPGSANWTHEHGDAANTRVSKDTIVKAPLGVLWFGGTSNEGILPRHGHGPQPQVVDGRIIIEGVDKLRAVDVYSGRLLWETKLPGVGAFYNNLAHQPGANSSGTNYISLCDGIYVAYGNSCLRLDPGTGKTLSEFKLPPNVRGSPASRWGYINVYGDYLIGGVDPLYDPKSGKEPDKKPKDKKDEKQDEKKDQKPDNMVDDDPGKQPNAVEKLINKVTKATNDNFSSSRHLVVMDRHTGKLLWTVSAELGFRHNAICAGGGRLYCIDRLSGNQLNKLKRRGEKPKCEARLLVFSLQTGKEKWRKESDVFGTWLSYSVARDVLIESGRVARDSIGDEPTGMRAYEGVSGRVLWYEKKHAGPAMIHGDTILMNGNASDLLTGKIKTRQDPLTLETVDWVWSRNYGCSTPAASEHLLTFRSGAAGFYDLCNDGGTGNLGGFRSSCTNNLIVANGVLSAPDYTRTCICNYQNQTSLALVHMPEAEMWTFIGPKQGKGRVKRLGLNFGAPGDRRAENGTLWVEYPSVGGRSPGVPVTTIPAKPEYLRRHSSQITGRMPWVGSSAVKGLHALTVQLSDKERGTAERHCTVRLHFAELEAVEAGERIFDVALQGETVLRGFDIVKEAGGRNRSLVKEFPGVSLTRELVVTFVPSSSAKHPASLLNGIEIVEEGP
jgi:outer membrane protein assembly factor BamB